MPYEYLGCIIDLTDDGFWTVRRGIEQLGKFALNREAEKFVRKFNERA